MNQIIKAFQDGTAALHRRGVTGIHDVRLMADQDGARAFQAFQKLDSEHNLDLRSWITLPGDRLDDIIGLGLRTGFGSDRLHVGHVKFFSDGGMGARTAWMIDPFLDAEYGMPLVDLETLSQDVQRADEAGLSVMVHAVGDRANRELIDLFSDLENKRAQSGRQRPFVPHRIEHVQMIRPDDVKRINDLHLALCVTPANMVLDINLIDTSVGEKGEYTYAFRSLMDTGTPVMFSSDCPVCDPDPLMGIHAAVSRQRSDGTPGKGWYPEQRVTPAEAIQAYTSIPARVHQAVDLGVLVPGNRADLAILSENILTIPPSTIPEAKVEMTVFDGEVVYRKF
jgi:predicted amidohydrolase YtcJ